MSVTSTIMATSHLWNLGGVVGAVTNLRVSLARNEVQVVDKNGHSSAVL